MSMHVCLIEDITVYLYCDGNDRAKTKIKICRTERGICSVMTLPQKKEMFCGARGELLNLTRRTDSLL